MLLRLRIALSGLRARVVLWYLALLAISLVVAVLALRQFLVVGLDDSVSESLTQEAEELRLLTGGNNPVTGKPFGNDVEAIFDPPRLGELQRSVLDTGLAQRELGFRAETSFADGISMTWESIRAEGEVGQGAN